MIVTSLHGWSSERAARSDMSYLAYFRPTPRPFTQFVSGHFPSGTITQSHSHPWIALHGCLQGPLTLCTERGELSLDVGTFYILAPGIKHYWRNSGDQTGATLGLLIDSEHAGNWPADSGVEECCKSLNRLITGIHRFSVAGDDELRHCFWLAADQLTAVEPREGAATFGALLALVALCVARLGGKQEESELPSDVAQQIHRLLLSRVNDRISINMVARELGISPTSAKAAFHKAFDSGIIAYHNQLKIWQAKRLLCDPALTVNEISQKLSFSSPSYFSRVFLQHVGESPSSYRIRNLPSTRM